jgi:hypothetical protein
MSKKAEDEDMKAAVNELGDAIEAITLGASSSEVQRLINAIDVLVQVRIAQFAELAADRVEVLS